MRDPAAVTPDQMFYSEMLRSLRAIEGELQAIRGVLTPPVVILPTLEETETEEDDLFADEN